MMIRPVRKPASGGPFLRRVRSAWWRLKAMAGVAPDTHEETNHLLARMAARRARYVPGRFYCPLGRIDYADITSTRYQYQDLFIKRSYDFEATNPAPVILDCGGNIGLSVIRFKECHPNASLAVFEPDPQIAGLLRANLDRLGLQDVNVFQQAAWTETGQAGFEAEGADAGHLNRDGAMTVNTVRLADQIAGPVDLLKLDIEGAEYPVVEDLCETGAIRHIRRLIVEVHGSDPKAFQLGELINQLSRSGLSMVVGEARVARQVPGPKGATPFPGAPSPKFLLLLYAWAERA